MCVCVFVCVSMLKVLHKAETAEQQLSIQLTQKPHQGYITMLCAA